MSSSFALCVLWMIVVAEGSFVYVSENGTTTTPCGASPAAACASIHLAVNMTHDNDSILLRAGDSFRVTQPLIVTAFNVSIDSYGAAAGSRATLVGDAATNAVFLFSQSFALANLNFALDHFDLYTTVIFCNATSAAAIRVENVSITQFNNALTAMRVRNHNQPPSASLCNRLYCAMIQMVPAGDFNVSLRQVEFSSANQLYAPFNSKLVYVGVGENRSATVLLDDVAAHHLTANSAMFELQCAAGASCRGEFNRVAIENSLASIVSDGVVSVVSHENSTMAVQFADCLFRNISSRVGGGLVRLTLSSMASNITMSNCSFIDNVGDQMQFTGGVLLTAGFSANTANMFALTVVDCTFSHNPRNRTVVGGGALSAFVSVVFLDSCVHGAVVVRRSLFQNGGGSALHVRPTANDCDQDTYRRTESILIEDCRFLNNLPGSNGVVLAQTSCLTSAWTMDVRRSSFLHNKAWTLSRGAPLNIVIDTESQIGFRATIDACLFVGNVAGDRSGAISLTQSSPGDLLMVPVTIQVFNCSLADNRHRGAGGSEQIVVDFAVVQLSGSVVVASSVGDDDVMDLASFGTLAVWTSNSAFSAINSSFQCAPGRSIAVEKEQSSEFNSVGNVDLVCTLCPVSTYNLAGAILNYNATGIVVPTEPFCLDCPIGSRMNCTGDTPGASQGFWARRHGDAEDLSYFKCPKNFCCQSADGCALPDACSGNRQGALCGACQPGFTHAFAMKSACVPESVCTLTRVWLGNAAVVGAALALVLYTTLRASAKSDGLIKVFVAFCNIAQVVMVNSLALAPTPTTDGTLSNAVYSSLSVFSGLFPQSVTVAAFCPLVTMTSFQKMLAPLFAPVALLVLWVIVSLVVVAWHAIKRRRRAVGSEEESLRLLEGEPSDEMESRPTYRIVASLLSLMDFALFIVVGTCVSLLTTVELVPLGNGDDDDDDTPQCRFWQAGDSECSPGTTAFASILLCVVLIAPVALIVWRRFRAHSPAGEAVYDVYQSAFSQHAQLYNFAIVGRRVTVAFVNAFVGDSELRVLLVRSVLVIACTIHVYYGAPFASKWVNRLEAASLCALLLATMIQWTSATAEHVEMYTTTSNIQGVILIFCFFALAIAVGWKLVKTIKCGGKSN